MTAAVQLDEDVVGHLPPGWGYRADGERCPAHAGGLAARVTDAAKAQGGER